MAVIGKQASWASPPTDEAVFDTAQVVQISSEDLIKAYIRIEDKSKLKNEKKFQKMKLLNEKKADFKIEDESKLKHENDFQKMKLLNEKKTKDALEDLHLQTGMKLSVIFFFILFLRGWRPPKLLPLLEYILIGAEIYGVYLIASDLYESDNFGHISRNCPSGGDRDPQDDHKCYNCGKPGHISRDCPSGEDRDRRYHLKCYTSGNSGHVSRDCSSGGDRNQQDDIANVITVPMLVTLADCPEDGN